MKGYNFTDRVRRVLALAREEAVRLQHQYIGTEHILLGLIREREGVGALVLRNFEIDLYAMRQAIDIATKGSAAPTSGPDLPYTPPAKQVLELAMKEATELHHSYVGTEHLLLGLLGEAKGSAAQVLGSFGVTLETARTEVPRILGTDMPVSGPQSRRAERSQPRFASFFATRMAPSC